jgi:hypothetical protein
MLLRRTISPTGLSLLNSSRVTDAPSTATLAPRVTSSAVKKRPDSSGHGRTSSYSALTPLTVLLQLAAPNTTLTLPLSSPETAATSGTFSRIARMSFSENGCAPPKPSWRPPTRIEPGITLSTLVPSILICRSIWIEAPSPIAAMTITEATPMMMPSVVSALRSLLSRNAASATLRNSSSSCRIIAPALRAWLPAASGSRPPGCLR